MKIKNILIVSYHFYPGSTVGAKRPSELALKLKESGQNVFVVAAKTDNEASLKKKVADITVTYVPVPPDLLKMFAHFVGKIRSRIQKNSGQIETDSKSATQESFLERIKRIIFSILAINESLSLWLLMVFAVVVNHKFRNNIDLIITSGPPMIVNNVGWLMNKIFGTKWVIDLRDPLPVLDLIYPDKNFLEPGVKSSIRKSIELYQEKQWLNSADSVVTTSPGVVKEITGRHSNFENKLHTVYNGFDIASPPKQSNDSSPVMTFLYAGMLYYNRNPFPLFESLKRLLNDKKIDPNKIQFVFYGKCDYWNSIDIKQWIDENGLSKQVKIHPPVSAEAIHEKIGESDILINFSQGQPLQIPAKTFEYIGSGKKSLVLTEHDSDSATLIRESQSGVIVDVNTDNIDNVLLNMYIKHFDSEKATDNINPVINNYSRDHQNDVYIELIKSL
ncbi:MAG: hypothetical protein GKR93_10650 [Gammaproteobacteria bacterium]|nr:hypothetical protein [Gammaproteobacteria bacterium]